MVVGHLVRRRRPGVLVVKVGVRLVSFGPFGLFVPAVMHYPLPRRVLKLLVIVLEVAHCPPLLL